ncbi:hypothetical protein [Solitalea canadensis]|nr:hypothetical protein [Solitalea canadensis]
MARRFNTEQATVLYLTAQSLFGRTIIATDLLLRWSIRDQVQNLWTKHII